MMRERTKDNEQPSRIMSNRRGEWLLLGIRHQYHDAEEPVRGVQSTALLSAPMLSKAQYHSQRGMRAASWRDAAYFPCAGVTRCSIDALHRS